MQLHQDDVNSHLCLRGSANRWQVQRDHLLWHLTNMMTIRRILKLSEYLFLPIKKLQEENVRLGIVNFHLRQSLKVRGLLAVLNDLLIIFWQLLADLTENLANNLFIRGTDLQRRPKCGHLAKLLHQIRAVIEEQAAAFGMNTFRKTTLRIQIPQFS